MKVITGLDIRDGATYQHRRGPATVLEHTFYGALVKFPSGLTERVMAEELKAMPQQQEVKKVVTQEINGATATPPPAAAPKVYRCDQPGCSFTSGGPRGIVAHREQAHGPKPAAATPVTPPAPEVKPAPAPKPQPLRPLDECPEYWRGRYDEAQRTIELLSGLLRR